MLLVPHLGSGERIPVVPGRWREHDVQVGRHYPPEPADLLRFLTRFDRPTSRRPCPSRDRSRRSAPRIIASSGSSLSRRQWPRGTAQGARFGIGTSLSSVARGLAREERQYTNLLIQADGPREGDRDGRGNLTQRGMIEFSRVFLERAIDQVRFMAGLLEPDMLLTRIKIHGDEEIRTKRRQRGSFAVLREAVLSGDVERAKILSLTGYDERAARLVTSALVARGMLTASSHRAPLKLACPADVAERWFPNLYPANAGTRP